MEKENMFLNEVFQGYVSFDAVFHGTVDSNFYPFVSVYGVHFNSDIRLEGSKIGKAVFYMNDLYFVDNDTCYLISKDVESWKLNEIAKTYECLKIISKAILNSNTFIFEIPNNATIEGLESKINSFVKIWKDGNQIRYIRYFEKNKHDFVYSFGYDFIVPSFIIRDLESIRDKILKVHYYSFEGDLYD